MEFWSIVLGVIAAVLLLAWRSDRRRGAGPLRHRRRDIDESVGIERSKQMMNRAETDRWGVFRGYPRR